MAEDGRRSERGHCLLALPRALALFVVRVLLRPDRWGWLRRKHRDGSTCQCRPAAVDDTMAVADAVAEPPKRRDVTAEQRRNWRASDAWLDGAVRDYDWTAAEADVTRRVR